MTIEWRYITAVKSFITLGPGGISRGGIVVQQGDALSCTLFIPPIETLLNNGAKRNDVMPLSSTCMKFYWPKAFGYRDVITSMTINEECTNQTIFEEYESWTNLKC
jgi:hypothetical protein